METPTHPDVKQPFIVASAASPTAYQGYNPDSERTRDARPLGFSRWWWQTIHTFWIIEALSTLFSILLFAAILIILWYYDKKIYSASSDTGTARSSQMKRPLLYTYLSLLSAFMRAAMLLPVATAISQLTWSWFRSYRPLIHIERFDDASRGIIGSFRLLWTLRFSNLAAIGAALTIFALPMDAVIQSSVLLPSRREINFTPIIRPDNSFMTNQTTIPKTMIFNESSSWKSSDTPYATIPMANMVRMGIGYLSGVGNLVPPLKTVDCPTGDCDFGTTQTLFVRSMCKDRSQDITTNSTHFSLQTADNQTVTLNRNMNQKEYTKAVPYLTQNKALFNGSFSGLIVRPVIMANVWNEAPLAMECALYWDIKTFVGRVNETTNYTMVEDFQETTTRFMTNNATGDKYVAIKLWPKDECWVNNKTLVKDENPSLWAEQCEYAITYNGHWGLQWLLIDDDEGLSGNVQTASRNSTTNKTLWSHTNPYIRNVYTIVNDYDREAAFGNVRTIHSNIAYFISQSVRRSKWMGPDGKYRRGNSTGTVYHNVIYYKIEWPRLAMPAIMVFGSAMFVIATAVVTRKQLQWKRSNLPILFHGLHEMERDRYKQARTLVDMEDVAQTIQVRLVDEYEEPRLTGLR